MHGTTFTEARYAALAAVYAGKICYQNGLARPGLGYEWGTGVPGPMTDEFRHTLRELWAADLIDIDVHRLFAPRGHRVAITAKGYRALREWSGLADPCRPANSPPSPQPGVAGGCWSGGANAPTFR
ncbi:hypothetical protein [Saccharopolyspora sp. ASAGF58]|uniref:hypothetical protein n=1 Tax=Saccharopolyspora sp. ASAGF58 TaxID=2719023 RepID=UPI001440247E|nr:hypothetical protein [Saccharopolyspora sp. ASAGF58]QIZ38718.1 hypothetical protein FDZ84_34690 [Saccharopolyspora sp. ASAGF58]